MLDDWNPDGLPDLDEPGDPSSAKPVARIGDETAHGGKIVQGDPTVLVTGKPIARVGDQHSCPSGHRGGPVLPPCATSVLVNGRPPARITDLCSCRCGREDPIVTGEVTVQIGITPSGLDFDANLNLTPQLAALGAGLGLSPKGQAVLQSYAEKLGQFFEVDIKDLINGDLDKKLSKEQAMDWVQGLLMDMPLGDTPLGRGVGKALGMSDEHLSLSPNELGSSIGGRVKEKIGGFVNELREEHPGLFYTGATLAAVGAGALTYSQGTDVLKKVGVDPKLSQSLFNDRVKLDEAVEFGPKLSDPHASLRAEEKVGDGFTLWQEVEAGGPDLKHVGLEKYSGGAEYTKQLGGGDHVSAGLGYVQDQVGGSQSITGNLSGQSGATTYGVDALLDPKSMDHQVEAYVSHQFSKNGSIEGFVRHDTFGGVSEQAAGVMLKFKF